MGDVTRSTEQTIRGHKVIWALVVKTLKMNALPW